MKISVFGHEYGYSETYLSYSRQYTCYPGGRRDYYRNFIYQESLAAIVQLFLSVSDTVVSTDREISAQETSFGAGVFLTWLRRGFPSFTETRKFGPLKHQVGAYRTRFGKRSLQTNLHFLNGKLLYVHLCFSGADDALQTALCTSLEEKYQCEILNQSAFCIEDRCGNRIKGSFGLECNLYYLGGNQEQRQLLLDELHRQVFKQENIRASRMRSLQRLL